MIDNEAAKNTIKLLFKNVYHGYVIKIMSKTRNGIGSFKFSNCT